MHGLINRSLERFLSDTYGDEVWRGIVQVSGLEFDHFEAMMEYEDDLTYAVIDAASARLNKDNTSILEDLGTYMVSHPEAESIRRLLRFGGVTFVEFLHSLDDLHDRAKLAVPELDLPQLTLEGFRATGGFKLTCRWPHKGAAAVLLGMLRAMADDYGALVFMEEDVGGDGFETVSIQLIESSFTDGRDFHLATQENGS